MIKKILKVLGLLLALVIVGVGLSAFLISRAFDESISKKYDVPVPEVKISTDPAVLARGKHLADSLGGCLACHGEDGAGGKLEDMGPLGQFQAPNITTGGTLGQYSDGELARLIKHGIRKDGTSVRFMPSTELNWWPEDDVAALASYLRTLPPKQGGEGVFKLGFLAKVLDRFDAIPIDIARRIDHANVPSSPPAAETPEYGSFIAKSCTGCHGETLSGGKLPGAPPELPIPLNLTAHETGLKDWTFADFDKLMREGVRKNGAKLNPFMPQASFKNYSELEMKALWAYLRSAPPKPFGGR